MIVIDTHTQICGIIGNPVDHSLSPAIHNAAFQQLGLNYVYLAFPVEDVASAVKGMRALGNLRGFSVTIPHKVAVIPFLDELEPTAEHIGSVNTIVVERGKLLGYNTDASGALRALRDGGGELKGQRVLMLGSGGAARAIAFALGAETGVSGLTVLGIDEQERNRLIRDLQEKTDLEMQGGGIDADRLRQAVHDADILLHCTPIGMYPNVEGTVVPKELLRPNLTVMDIVYNPLETRLLREAKAVGCRTIRGVEMFINQAVSQFELWTGQAAPTEVMRAVVESRFA